MVGGEVAVHPPHMLVAPTGMVSSGAARETAEDDVVEGRTIELRWRGARRKGGGERWVRGVRGGGVVVLRMEGLEGLDGGGSGIGELGRVGSREGT